MLLASNHQSYLDPVFIGAFLSREMYFMARDTLFKNCFFGPLIRSLNAYPVKRGGGGDLGAIRDTLRRLRDGEVVLVFPEGTRTTDGTVKSMQGGIGMLAGRAGVPVVPVYVDGAFSIWKKGAMLPRLFGRVRVCYGRPLMLGVSGGAIST